VCPVQTQDGAKVLLYFRDGSSQFWADRAAIRTIKSYDRPQTIRGLQEYAAGRRAEREAEAARQAAQRTPEQIEADRAADVARIRALAESKGAVIVEPMKQRSLDRLAKGGVAVGDVVGPRKDGTWLLVVAVGTPYYVSRRDCEDAEDNGRFGLEPGWRTPYEAVQIEEPPVQRAAREQAAAEQAKAEADYRSALAPALAEGYRARHGSAIGGTIRMDNEAMVEHPVMCDLGALAWEQIAQRTTRATEGSIAGRVADRDTLYRAALPDGRYVYREEHYRSFGDDLRTSVYMPEDVFLAACRAEIATLGITPEAAREWLAQYRGCVGTELYEIAAGDAA